MSARLMAVAAAVGLVSLTATDEARAYSYNTCDDEKIIWTETFSMVRNSCSISSSGSRWTSMNNGIDRWRGVGDMDDMVSLFGSDPDCHFYYDDSQNDVAVVDEDDIDGAAGLTVSRYSPCYFLNDSEIVSADVMAASNLSFIEPQETHPSGDSGRTTFLHEFGHAHGLEHANGYDIMRTALPVPVVGGAGERVDVLGDDAAGGRFLYPQSGSETNLFASAIYRDVGSNQILSNTGDGPVYSCTGGGGSISILTTVGNNGTNSVTQTERWYLSTNINAYGGTTIYQWNNSTFSKENVNTRWINFTMPAMSVGHYYLFHAVDALGAVSESRESDNVAREALVVEVISC